MCDGGACIYLTSCAQACLVRKPTLQQATADCILMWNDILCQKITKQQQLQQQVQRQVQQQLQRQPQQQKQLQQPMSAFQIIQRVQQSHDACGTPRSHLQANQIALHGARTNLTAQRLLICSSHSEALSHRLCEVTTGLRHNQHHASDGAHTFHLCYKQCFQMQGMQHNTACSMMEQCRR